MQPKGSPPYDLVVTDVKKIAWGALLAGLGAVAAYLSTDVIPVFSEDTSDLGKLTIAAVASVLMNAIRKFISNTQV
jgi:hypothetical protein